MIAYQRDLVALQLERSADAARRRKAYLAAIRTPDDQAAESAKCKQDTVHWFNQWAWTMDPRTDSPLAIMPFELFDFQVELVRWLDKLVFLDRRSGVEEKSRDMGATWINCGWAVKHWLYFPAFQALFSSRNEQEVDSKKEPDTIFEKLRFIVRHLPPFMRPEGYREREHATFCNLTNPVTGAVISGAAPTIDVGRGGRYTVVLPDEYASFPNGGNAQFMSMKSSTKSIIAVSTPKGKLNRFYKMLRTPGMPVKTLHWTLHPWRDDRWRRGQELESLPHEVAQEVEIDYDASETGQILKEFDELVHLVTWRRFAEVFGEPAKDWIDQDTWIPRLPACGSICVAMDWGETLGHPTAVVWIWRPPARMPYSDCLFIYRTMVRPEWPKPPVDWKPPTARRMANEITAAERHWREGALVERRLMSPEQLDVKLCFRGDPNASDPLPEYLRLPFEGWVARNNYGTAQLQNAIEVDWERYSPFNVYPNDYGADGSRDAEMRGKPLPGYTRLYVLVDEAQGGTYADHTTEIKVRQATDDRGAARLRAEFPAKKRDTDTAGDERKDPKKIFDDVYDAVRGALSQFGPAAVPMTAEELAERAIADKRPDLEPEQIATLDPEAQIAALITKSKQFQKELADAKRASGRVLHRDPFGGTFTE